MATVGLISAGTLYATAHGGDGAKIHACVTTRGAIRIVTADVACGRGETALDWNITGPQGVPGPQGPAAPNGIAPDHEVFLVDGTNDPDLADVGAEPSIAIGTDGLALLAYVDVMNGALKVAHCQDSACSTATTNTLETVGPGPNGQFRMSTSITIGADGLGLIVYATVSGADSADIAWSLKVAHCDDAACSTATLTTVATASSPALDGRLFLNDLASITTGDDGLGLISYFDADPAALDLTVAHCDNAACTTSTTTTVDSSLDYIGQSPSISIGADGLGLISYLAATNGLNVAHCDNALCTTSTTTAFVIDPPAADHSPTALAVGADGLGLVVWTRGVLHCDDAACATATISDLGLAAHEASVAVGTDGRTLIAYRTTHGTGDELHVARCSSAVCTAVAVDLIEDGEAGFQLGSPAIVVGADGHGLIAYYDARRGNLRVVH